MNIVQHVFSTQSQQTILRTPPYASAQTSNKQPTTFTRNTIHTNPLLDYPSTSRTLSRPPLHLIPNNTFSYTLPSTNNNNSQQPRTMSHPQSNNIQITSLSTSQITQPPSTTIRTNPHFYNQY